MSFLIWNMPLISEKESENIFYVDATIGLSVKIEYDSYTGHFPLSKTIQFSTFDSIPNVKNVY